ncbi:uncharacterized protein LOC135849662 [Planococcus citri]|uniref:uncharacterized protein LOC135844801 n=1 Tax=Planococcus citri TaxID=170843 RepID=UPI0031F7BAC1
MSRDTSIEYPKASDRVVKGGLLVYIGGLFLMVSFFSPYWISSYDESFSTFKNMGVWEYCFSNFRYPAYQFDKVFDGCRGVLSDEYYVIREWLLPGWLLALEFFITIGLICTLGAQLVLAGVVTRYPLEFILRHEYLLITGSCIASAVTNFCLFMMIIIFPWNCWRRDWLLNPMFNHLSWAYYSLFFSLFFHAIGTNYLYKESRYSWDKRKENRSLIMQMYPRHDRNGFY